MNDCYVKNKFSFLSTIFLLFFFLYGVDFTFTPTFTSRIIAFIGFVYLAIYSLNVKKVHFHNDFVFILFCFTALLLYSLFMSGINGFKDPSISISLIIILLQGVVGVTFFFFIFNRMGFDSERILDLILTCIVIQSIFVILFFISIDFKMLTFKFIPERGNIDHTVNLIRSRGLTHGASATLSVVQSLGMLISVYLLSIKKATFRYVLYYSFAFSISLLSVFLTGRTGLLMIVFVAIYIVAVTVHRMKIKKSLFYFAVVLPVLAISGVLILRLLYNHILGGFTTEWGEDGFDQLVRWIKSGFFSSDGNIESRTVVKLLDHWFLPSSLHDFIFGDLTAWSVNRIPSDVGYIKMLHATGFIATSFFYTVVFLMFLSALLKSKGVHARTFIIVFCLFVFLIEAKEPFVLNIFFFTFLAFLLVTFHSFQRKFDL